MFIRRSKQLIARVCIAALLFSQLAVAAYACPTVGGPANAIVASIAGDMHAAMPGCEMVKNDNNPNLCLQHCQAADQSVQALSQIELPAFTAIATFLIIEPAHLKADIEIAVASALPEREKSPPPLVRFRVLRI